MATYTTDDILRDVRVALDENGMTPALLAAGDPDTLTLDEIIFSKIEEGVRRVHSTAPIHALDAENNFDENGICWEAPAGGDVAGSAGRNTFAGRMRLPADFLRLVAFRMSDWQRTVYTATTAGEPEYELQASRYAGVRGTPQRPVVAIVMRPGGLWLEFFSCRSREATVHTALYLPEPHIDPDGGIKICTRCYKAAVYMIAALTLATVGEAEKAQVLTDLGKGYIV